MASTLIARLDRWLSKKRPAFYKSLRKGVSKAAIAKAEKRLGKFPPTLAALFRWRNGGHDGRFQNNWSLMSLGEGHAIHDMLDELLSAGAFGKPLWWKSSWFPFLENGGGDHVCVDLETGEVCQFWHDEDWRTIEYPSIDKWLEVFVITLEAGIWAEDEEYAFFEPAERPFARTRKQLAPGYPKKRDAHGPKRAARVLAQETAEPPPSKPAIDQATAKRLVSAWLGGAKGATDRLTLHQLPTGFWAAPKFGFCEAEYVTRQRRLIVRYAPVGLGADGRGARAERQRFAAGVVDRKRTRLAGTTSEVVQLHAYPDDGWFIVLRMDFGDPTMTEAAFIAAVDQLRKLMTVWRASR